MWAHTIDCGADAGRGGDCSNAHPMKFLKSPLGIVVAVLAVVLLTVAYGSRLPAFVKTVASKLPGATPSA